MPLIPQRVYQRIARSPLAPAVVVGTDVTGASVARALAMHGVPVIGVDDCVRKYIGHSRAFQHVHIMEQGFREPGIVPELEVLAAALPRRAVLFLSMDHHVTIIGAHGQHLPELYAFETADNASVELLMDKQRFADFAVRQGWPVPRTFSCDSLTDIEEMPVREARFPVILKPRVKTPRFAANSRFKVYRCATPEELWQTYRMVSDWEPGVIVQEWIPGGDGEVYFSFHYLAADGRQVGTFEGRKLRQYPPECGNTTAAVPVAEPALEALSLEILRTSGARGFCAVEYKRDPRSGTYHIMEPTIGRVNLQIGTAIANGANIPWAAYRHLAGLPAKAEHRPARARTWVYLKNDLKSARYHVAQGNLSWSGYLGSLAGRRAFAVWRWNEYPMALAILPHQVARVRRFIARRTHALAARLPVLKPLLRKIYPLLSLPAIF
jgi:predicted ATP-grasp superfamily ATP-dependent carboligase